MIIIHVFLLLIPATAIAGKCLEAKWIKFKIQIIDDNIDTTM